MTDLGLPHLGATGARRSSGRSAAAAATLAAIALLTGCGPAPTPPAGPPAAGQGAVDVDAAMATCSALGGDDAPRIAACSAIIQAANAPAGQRAIALNNRGLLLAFQGDQDRAIADFGAALRINPAYAAAFHNRAYAWRQKGEAARADADAAEAARLQPGLARH